MNSIRQMLDQKGHQVWQITPEDTVYHALQLMAERNVGALVVVRGEKVVGMFTERDYARKVALAGKSSKVVTVGELMTSEVLYISPDETIENCMALMTSHHARHLPVMENDRLVGLVSIGDIVKAVISDREFVIRELERYITGGHTSA